MIAVKHVLNKHLSDKQKLPALDKQNTGQFVLKLQLRGMTFWPLKTGDCLIQVTLHDRFDYQIYP